VLASSSNWQNLDFTCEELKSDSIARCPWVAGEIASPMAIATAGFEDAFGC